MNLCVKKTSSHVAMEIASREVSFVTMRRTVMMAQMKMLVVSYLFDHYSAIQIQPKKKHLGYNNFWQIKIRTIAWPCEQFLRQIEISRTFLRAIQVGEKKLLKRQLSLFWWKRYDLTVKVDCPCHYTTMESSQIWKKIGKCFYKVEAYFFSSSRTNKLGKMKDFFKCL